MKTWLGLFFERLDTLATRIFLVQLVAGVILLTAFFLLVLNDQTKVSARATAPIWAAAIKPLGEAALNGQALQVPSHEVVSTELQLEGGPPPSDAFRSPLWRYRHLLAELQELGVPAVDMAISADRQVTWIELGGEAGHGQWVGVRGSPEGENLRARSAMSLLLALMAFVILSYLVGRHLSSPLSQLDRKVSLFASSGTWITDNKFKGPREIRWLNQRFEQFALQRQGDEEALNMLLAGLSHDLRTPITRIRAAVDLLPDDPSSTAKREQIVRNCEVADRLVGTFRELARATAEPLHERVELGSLVREAVAAAGDDLQVINEHPQPLWIAPASAIGLERLLLNLIDNAYKHGAAPIEVTLRKQARQAVLSVRDHGTGVAAADRQRLLQPFFRGDVARTTPGMGLGLSIVQASVRRHGGTFDLLDAQPGLEVQVKLPLARDAGER